MLLDCLFRDTVSLYSPGCPQTHYVAQAGPQTCNLPVSTSTSLGFDSVLVIYSLGAVLVRVSIPGQNIMTKKQLGRKGFIQLTLLHCYSSLKEVRTGTQADQEAGADADAMEGCSLLACFPWLAQPVLL